MPSPWASSGPRLATAGLLALAGLWRAAQAWPARPVFPNGPDLSLWLDAIVAVRSFDLAELSASGRPYVYPILAAALPLPVGDAGTALSYLAWALLPAVMWLSACRLAGPIPALLPTAIAWGSMRFAEAVPFTNAQTLLDLLVVAYVGFAPRPDRERGTVAFVALGLGLGLVKEQGLLVGVGATVWALASGARWAAVARGVALAALPYLVTMGLETWLVGRPPKAVLPLADLLGLSGFGGQRSAAAIPFERQLDMNVNTLRLFFQTHEWVVLTALLAVPLVRSRGPGARVGLWLACVVAFFGVALVVMFQRYHTTTGLALLTLGTVWIPARWVAVGRSAPAGATGTTEHEGAGPGGGVAAATPGPPSALRVLPGILYAGVLLGWVPYWAADQARGRTFLLTRSPSHQNAQVLAQAVEQLDAFPEDAPVACLESSIARVAGRATITLVEATTLPCGSPVLWPNPLPPIIPKELASELQEWPVRWRGSVPGTPDLRLSVLPCAAADPLAPVGPDAAKPDGGERQDQRGG